MSLFGKMHSVQLRVSQPGFSFENMLQVGNLVPDSCEMADGVEGFLELPLGLSAQISQPSRSARRLVYQQVTDRLSL